MYYIGIDIGSSFMKYALLDMNEKTVVEMQKNPTPNKIQMDANYKFEIPAQKILQELQEKIHYFIDKYQEIEGIVFSTQMHGYVYQTNSTEDMYVSWQDTRCLMPQKDSQITYLETLKTLIPKERMESSGVYMKPSLGLCNLYTQLQQEGDLEKDGTLYTLGSYIIHTLTGNNICHMTNAAPLGLVHLAKREWDKDLLQTLGLNNIQLPEIAKSDFQVCGVYAYGGQELKLFPDFGDQQCAILGATTLEENAVVNIATAAQVSVITNELHPGNYEIRPFFEGKYINTISNMPSGRNLDVLISFVQKTIKSVCNIEVSKSQVWAGIDTTQPWNEKLSVNTSFFPISQIHEGGSISGITNDNLNFDAVILSCFYDMAKTYWKHILELQGNQSVQKIICAGGVSWKQERLVSIIGEVAQKECCVSAFEDEVVFGLYSLAQVCCKMRPALEEKTIVDLKLK